MEISETRAYCNEILQYILRSPQVLVTLLRAKILQAASCGCYRERHRRSVLAQHCQLHFAMTDS